MAKAASAESFLFLSDIHLTESEDHPGLWKKFKDSQHHVDDDLVQLLDKFQAQRSHAKRHLVLNGDNFDFRLVLSRPDGRQDSNGLRATVANSAWRIVRILKDHPLLASKLSRFAETDTIHILPGNHDLEFNLAAVRRAFRGYLYALSSKTVSRRAFNKNIKFYQNHYYRPGMFYVEHGNNYDPYCSMPDVRNFKPRRELILPFGDYASIFMTNRMGHFNPFHAESYILSAAQYVKIFFKYNFFRSFTRDNLPFNWFWGAVKTLFKSLSVARYLKFAVHRQPRDSSVSPQLYKKLALLRSKSIYNDLGLMLRTLWLDRFLLAGFITVTVGAAWISGWLSLVGGTAALGYSAFYFINVRRVREHNPTLIDNAEVGQKIQKILKVPFVVMGHTHAPIFQKIDKAAAFVDLGTWSPCFKDIECTLPDFSKRRIFLLDSKRGKLTSIFQNWVEFTTTSAF